MTSWIATSRSPGEIPDKPTVIDGRSSPKVKAQVEAAAQCAELMAQAIDEDCNVSMSGYAATKGDTEPDQIRVVVVKAGEA